MTIGSRCDWIDEFAFLLVWSCRFLSIRMGSGRYDEMGSTRVSWRWFFMMICSAQMVGVIAIILLAVVLGQYKGGFTWTVNSLCFSTWENAGSRFLSSSSKDSEKELNYHPLFMSLGMIFFYGDGKFSDDRTFFVSQPISFQRSWPIGSFVMWKRFESKFSMPHY